jgi:hypothetical protein
VPLFEAGMGGAEIGGVDRTEVLGLGRDEPAVVDQRRDAVKNSALGFNVRRPEH